MKQLSSLVIGMLLVLVTGSARAQAPTDFESVHETLASHLCAPARLSGDVAARSVEALNEASLDRIDRADDSAFAANAAGGASAAISLTRCLTRSAASAGSRSYCPSARRCTIATSRSTIWPVSRNPPPNDAMRLFVTCAVRLLRNPTTGIVCCARAASGIAAAPPNKLMNSRRQPVITRPGQPLEPIFVTLTGKRLDGSSSRGASRVRTCSTWRSNIACRH
jgi:hypothetical protein